MCFCVAGSPLNSDFEFESNCSRVLYFCSGLEARGPTVNFMKL